MQKTHWKQLVNLDYIGAYALNGEDLTLTIRTVRREIVTGANGKKEECMVMYWAESGYKPMILNRTNAKTISGVCGSSYVEDWAGKRITLYPTTTKFGGEVVECLRVRATAPAAAKIVKCEKCGNDIRPAGRMNSEQLAEYTLSKYGMALCSACATAAKEASSNAEADS
jgi:uncharacterized protein with PIN domain